MEFEWDDEKDRSNRAKHGISFEQAMLVFLGITLTRFDDRQDYGELREITIGQIGPEVVVVVVHTDREGATRLISARPANRAERNEYDAYCAQITR